MFMMRHWACLTWKSAIEKKPITIINSSSCSCTAVLLHTHMNKHTYIVISIFKAVLNWAWTHLYEQPELFEVLGLAVSLYSCSWLMFSLLASGCFQGPWVRAWLLEMFPAQDMGASFWLVKLSCGWRRRNTKEGRSTRLRFERLSEPIFIHFVHRLVRHIWYSSYRIFSDQS